MLVLQFEQSVKAADAAYQQIQEERKGLYREDGKARYSPQEMGERAADLGERQGEIEAGIKDARSQAYAGLDEKRSEIQAKMALLEGSPAQWLGGRGAAMAGWGPCCVHARLLGTGADPGRIGQGRGRAPIGPAQLGVKAQLSARADSIEKADKTDVLGGANV